MSIFICPGFHLPELTQCLLQQLLFPANSSLSLSEKIRVFPATKYTALSPLHIMQDLIDTYGQPPVASPILFIGFSAGVIGARGAAWGWQARGRSS